MTEVVKNFIHKNKLADGSWEILYPRTTAGQVLTDETKQFVSAEQVAAFTAKAEATDVANALAEAKSYADTAVAGLVDSAPEQLNTLRELAEALQAADGELDGLLQVVGEKATKAELQAHIDDKNNPHGVTAEQVGLGNVNNTSDADKPISTATAAEFVAVRSELSTALAGVPTTTISATEPTGVPTGSFWYEIVQ